MNGKEEDGRATPAAILDGVEAVLAAPRDRTRKAHERDDAGVYYHPDAAIRGCWPRLGGGPMNERRAERFDPRDADPQEDTL